MVDGPSGRLNFVGIHSLPLLAAGEARAVLQQCLDSKGEDEEVVTWLMGDFNFTLHDEERLDLKEKQWHASRHSVAGWFMEQAR